MAPKQTSSNEEISIAQVVTESTRAVIQTMTMAETARSQYVGPNLGRLIMKQLTFDWSSTNKYTEL